jgi:bacterioferritin
MQKKSPTDPVITVLNDVLTAELTAINQYFLHAELCQHWGYEYLYKTVRSSSIDEMKHAEKCVERILYLDGLPNMQRLAKVSVGESVKEQFDLDMKLEMEAVERLVNGIKVCDDNRDVGSRLLLEEILKSEEEHIDWLDSQIELIRQVGEQNYLAEQIRKS